LSGEAGRVISRSGMNSLQPPGAPQGDRVQGLRSDIVKQGSVRRLAPSPGIEGVLRTDLRRHHCLTNTKRMTGCAGVSLEASVRQSRT